MSAVQPRINKAIADALRADTSLANLFVSAGGVLDSGEYLPLYWMFAPPRREAPYLVFRKIGDETTEYSRCGIAVRSRVPYSVDFITPGVDPDNCIAVVDRMAILLDGLRVAVDGLGVLLHRSGGDSMPDYNAGEAALTITSLYYDVLVTH